MTEEHTKLVAKIQHFYDHILRLHEQIIDDQLMNDDKKEDSSLFQILKVVDEYEKVFNEFLYKS